MPNIIESLIPNFAGDSVLVTDQNGNQVFARARTMNVEVRPTSKPMEHPIETGAIITDHRILMPVEIELSLILQSADYKDTYKEIVHYYTNAILLVVQCKAGNFTNQLIQSLPHREDAEHYDALLVALKLKQVLIANTAVARLVPASPTNTSTVQRGTQNSSITPPATEAQATAQTQPFLTGKQLQFENNQPMV